MIPLERRRIINLEQKKFEEFRIQVFVKRLFESGTKFVLTGTYGEIVLEYRYVFGGAGTNSTKQYLFCFNNEKEYKYKNLIKNLQQQIGYLRNITIIDAVEERPFFTTSDKDIIRLQNSEIGELPENIMEIFKKFEIDLGLVTSLDPKKKSFVNLDDYFYFSKTNGISKFHAKLFLEKHGGLKGINSIVSKKGEISPSYSSLNEKKSDGVTEFLDHVEDTNSEIENFENQDLYAQLFTDPSMHDDYKTILRKIINQKSVTNEENLKLANYIKSNPYLMDLMRDLLNTRN